MPGQNVDVGGPSRGRVVSFVEEEEGEGHPWPVVRTRARSGRRLKGI